MQYVKDNKKSSIVAPLPNEAILADGEDKEILDKAAKTGEELQDIKSTKKYKILTEDLNYLSKDAIDFIKQCPKLTFGNLSESAIPGAINNAWKKLKSINKDIALMLLQYEKAGYGRTELFLNFAFDDIDISGGGESFDVKAGSNKYEVKSYEKLDDIRLGNEGNVTSFPDYNVMFSMYNTINKIISFNDDQMNAFLQMLNSIDEKKQYTIEEIKKQILPSKTAKDKEIKMLPECLREGSVSGGNLKLLDKPLRYFGEIVMKLHKVKFDYMKIVSKDTLYPIISIDDKDMNNIKVQVSGKITKEEEIEVINVIHELFMLMKSIGLIDSSGNFDNKKSYTTEMLENMNKQVNELFSNHPMLVIKSFKSSKENKTPIVITDDICFGVFRKFEINRITQGKVKVVPIG
ncbi:MAG: hypothetical protein EOL97_15315 [Spirochaetia bacterium]|nr:hypothetical protein [Spirochaetia bacterium]